MPEFVVGILASKEKLAQDHKLTPRGWQSVRERDSGALTTLLSSND